MIGKSVFFAVAAALCASCAQTATLSTDAVAVRAIVETAAVDATGDAADDPAIWVAADPAHSLVIATQKQGGLYVFDLAGAVTQTIPGGRPNNVDLRADFPWPEGSAPIVGAGDRADNAIALWRFNEQTRSLEPDPRAHIATPYAEIYGFCLGRWNNDVIAVATTKLGDVGVWRLRMNGAALEADTLLNLQFGERTERSIMEGCVVDDETGVLYVAQELVGVWRVPLGAPDERRLIDRVGDGNLVADVEGLTLWTQANGAGYLLVSVQGANRYAVYDRGGDNAYRGAFSIAPSAGGAADGVGGTDGIDVVSAPLGAAYPQGLFVAQDDENTDPAALQNFKYVSVADILTALDLN